MADLPDTLTIRLRNVLTISAGAATQTWAKLELREPRVEEFEKLQGMGSVSASAEFLFLITGILPAAIDQIRARDFKTANAYLSAMCATLPAVADPPETLTIPLRAPITDDDDTLFALELSEPTTGQLKAVEAMTGVKEMKTLIALVSGQPVARIQRLGMRDYRQAEAYLTAFL